MGKDKEICEVPYLANMKQDTDDRDRAFTQCSMMKIQGQHDHSQHIFKIREYNLVKFHHRNANAMFIHFHHMTAAQF